MPRLSQLNEKYASEAFLREIRTQQGAAGLMNNRALADATGIPYQTLLRRLQHPEDFTLGELRKLIKAIPLQPVELLRFVYPSKDIQKLKGGIQ